jgi:hypothetical protein
MIFRQATDADWPQMWPIVESVVASGESYAHPENFTGDEARAILMADEPQHWGS